MKLILKNMLKLLCAVMLCSVCAMAADTADHDKVQNAASMSSVDKAERLRLENKLGHDDLHALCSGVKGCLNRDLPGCDELDKKLSAKIKYDTEYCAPFIELEKRGLKADMKNAYAPEIFARLGRKYRAIYENVGELSANEHMISFLFDNMPFTAQLINAYMESNYVLEYTHPNRRYFNGSNGRSLSGEFYWALQDSAGTKLGFRNVFFGYGHAKVLRWALHGTAVAYLDMDPIPGNKIKYKLTAIVFPANSVLNSIMQMNVFKSVVDEKIDHIVDDIKKSSGRYFKGDKEPMLTNTNLKSAENVQNILDFEAVVNGAPWRLGDYTKLKKLREEQRNQPNMTAPLRVEEFQKIKETK